MSTQSTTAAGGTGRSPRHRAPSPQQRPGRRATHRIGLALVPALALLAARVWLLEPAIVSSDSMEPTIAEGAVVLMSKPGAAAGVDRGVVVAFRSPEDGHTAIKRVVALEGQVVAIRDSELYLDGRHVEEPFIDHSRIDATYFGPVAVPAGTVFVLGDNRGVSIDSRDYGPVPLSAVRGVLLAGRK